MATPTPSLQPALLPSPPWRAATRIAFRFSFIYLGLYIVLTQMLTSLLLATTNDAGAFEIDQTAPVRGLITWMAAHVFHVGHALVTRETGSGDRVYDWVELAGILALALLGTVAWSVLDRKRPSYPTLYKWFRVVVRFALGATMLTYGAVKIFPLQMPFPGLARLLEPFGNFSPMGVLWASIGSAQAYEIFAGCAEFLGGVLLFLPRTATLGALIVMADATQVFMLNMTYDVPVKLLSFHLIPLSLFVLAPETRRLANVLFLNRIAHPSSEQPLFVTRKRNRIALGAQVAFGLFLVGANLYGSVSEAAQRPPSSPLYGIWTVDNFTVNGQVHLPLLTDTQRWRRVICDYAQFTTVQGMDDSNRGYASAFDLGAHTLTLTRAADKQTGKQWKATFSFARSTPTTLTLTGAMDGHRMQAQLSLVDRSKMMLVSRGFHWVQDYPFNH